MDLSNLTSAFIKAEIVSMSKDRFVVEEDGLSGTVFSEIIPESFGLGDAVVISLKRNHTGRVGRRTLLIAVLDTQDKLKSAIQWAAVIKDELTEPENGDIYLFIALKEKMTLEQCTAIESSDRICRRHVLRPDETVEDFLGRSFIGPALGSGQTQAIADPLNLALEKTADKYDWLTSKEQKIWRAAFLSGKTPTDIINSLFK
jgi:hypothetical protein